MSCCVCCVSVAVDTSVLQFTACCWLWCVLLPACFCLGMRAAASCAVRCSPAAVDCPHGVLLWSCCVRCCILPFCSMLLRFCCFADVQLRLRMCLAFSALLLVPAAGCCNALLFCSVYCCVAACLHCFDVVWRMGVVVSWSAALLLRDAALLLGVAFLLLACCFKKHV